MTPNKQPEPEAASNANDGHRRIGRAMVLGSMLLAALTAGSVVDGLSVGADIDGEWLQSVRISDDTFGDQIPGKVCLIENTELIQMPTDACDWSSTFCGNFVGNVHLASYQELRVLVGQDVVDPNLECYVPSGVSGEIEVQSDLELRSCTYRGYTGDQLVYQTDDGVDEAGIGGCRWTKEPCPEQECGPVEVCPDCADFAVNFLHAGGGESATCTANSASFTWWAHAGAFAWSDYAFSGTMRFEAAAYAWGSDHGPDIYTDAGIMPAGYQGDAYQSDSRTWPTEESFAGGSTGFRSEIEGKGLDPAVLLQADASQASGGRTYWCYDDGSMTSTPNASYSTDDARRLLGS